MSYEPLHGTRVLDLTAVVVGPAATWRLGQYGAQIIKVESPGGDLMRGLGGLSPTGQHAGAYLHLNRGKRNICLDLKAPGASGVMERLVAWADVIVANMRPKALARLGLDPETVRAGHPGKIYCLLTGYGSDGPYGGFPMNWAGATGPSRCAMAITRKRASASISEMPGPCARSAEYLENGEGRARWRIRDRG